MGNFRNKLAAFFAGRYGNDQLGFFNLTIILILGILNIFLSSLALSILQTLFLVLWVFRFFSRKKDKRFRENAAFLRFWHKIGSFFSLQWKRIRDCKTSVYRRCPHCKATLRLPHKRGKHTVCCPKCKEKFDVRVL